MITLQTVTDLNNRRSLSVSSLTEDRKTGWDLTLLSADFPSWFVSEENPDVTLAIISGDDWQPEGETDTMLIPVMLSGAAHIGGETRYYYRQRFDNSESQIAPSLQLNCFITQNQGDVEITNPHLLVTFTTVSQTSSKDSPLYMGGQHELNSSFSNSENDLELARTREGREHVDRNEIANGGLDLAVGEPKNNAAFHERESVSV